MNPQNRTLGAPLCEEAALKEPYPGSSLIILRCYVVVFRRIWRGNPISGILLQLVTYQRGSASVIQKGGTN